MNIFNIPLGRPFFATLVQNLLGGKIIPVINPASDPLILSDLTIYVPTRRAARALAQVISAEFSPSPAILPRILTLGDADDLNERSLLNESSFSGLERLKPAIPTLSRQLRLTALIEQWRIAVRSSLLKTTDGGQSLLKPHDLFQVASSSQDAFSLAGDLADLMDEMTIEEIDWAKLGTLAPDYDEYWTITLHFLEIASKAWPSYLADNQLMDQSKRHHDLLKLEAERLSKAPVSTPMIVAGSTGSQLATAALIASIAHLPNGAIILPGLDKHLSNEDWQKIPVTGQNMALGITSPQATLKRLLELRLRADRSAVVDLGEDTEAWSLQRRQLVSEILRPADTTDQWVDFAKSTDNKLSNEGLTLIEAADEREEALSIALVLRHALCDTDKQIALVTPDRALATRVSSELARFDLNVDDSAGQTLAGEPRGILARLALDVAVSDFSPQSVLSLLHHSSVTLGQKRVDLEKAIAALDICALRAPFEGTSISALRNAVKQAQKPRRLSSPERRLMDELGKIEEKIISPLETAFLPLMKSLEGPSNLSAIAYAHEATLASLTLDEVQTSSHLNDADGQVLQSVFEDLFAQTFLNTTRSSSEMYMAVFTNLSRTQTVHKKINTHPRLHIWGQLESRLLNVDLVVLGGLNEGSWPPTVQTDAFLNRPMRTNIGLSPPERRIGQSAHDFSMLMGTEQVVLTRSARSQDQPTIASRFLRRLKAYSGDEAYRALGLKGDYYINLARHLDDGIKGQSAKPVTRPEPKPPVSLRPKRLSLTEIETLYRDPYAIFAKHILRLEPLNDRFAEPDAAIRGSLIHDALAEFTQHYPDSLPDNALKILFEIGTKHFAPFMHNLDVATFWWPRFELTAVWFTEKFETERRTLDYTSFVELDGALSFNLRDGSSFTLKGRLDRVDLFKSGSFAVLDYKTGNPPSSKEVLAGFNTQLTLEAAMVKAGAFKGISDFSKTKINTINELSYIKLLGSASKPGHIIQVKPPKLSLDDVSHNHLEQLKKHLMRYRDENKGYISRRAPKKTSYQSPYDHLARVKEWADADDRDNEE